MPPTRALADTSVFVAIEHGREIDAPAEASLAISVVTVTELRIGVLQAGDRRERTARQATLDLAQRFIPLAYDEPVAECLARIIHALRTEGRRVNVFDAIIAATAVAHGLPVWTQDADFDVIERYGDGPSVLRA